VNDGNSIHHLKEYLCENWDNSNYEYCNEAATVIDLTTITGYQACDFFWVTCKMLTGWCRGD